MKLYVDPRLGSASLVSPLKKIIKRDKKHLVELVDDVQFDAGDVKWEQHGKKYCIEVKKLSDVLQCIGNGRFVSQLRRMQEQVDHYWLLIIDEFRATSAGELEFRKYFGKFKAHWFKPFANGRGEVTAYGLYGWLTSMELPGGCHLWHAPDYKQAAHWIYGKFLWSLKKDEQHKSLNVFDTSRPSPTRDKKRGGVRFLGKPNEIAQVANALVRGIGWEKAKVLSYGFRSVEDFMFASREDLMSIKGVGDTLADDIIRQRSKIINKEVVRSKKKIKVKSKRKKG